MNKLSKILFVILGLSFFAFFALSSFGQKNEEGNKMEMFEQAQKFFDEKSFKRAYELYEQLIKDNSNFRNMHRILFNSAVCLYQLNNYDEAIKRFEEVIEKYPNTKFVGLSYFNIANALLNKDRYINRNKAIKYYKTAIEQLEKFSSKAEIKAKIVEVFFELAKIQNDKWNWATNNDKIKTNEAYETLDNIRNYSKDQNILSKALFTKAEYMERSIYSAEVNFDEVIKIYKQVVSDYKTSKYAPEAQFKVGQLYLNHEYYAEAVEAYKKLIDEFPKSSFVEAAKRDIKQITTPQISLSINRIFNSSEIPFVQLNSRNISRIYFKVTKVDVFDVLKKLKNLSDFKNYNDGKEVKTFQVNAEYAKKYDFYDGDIKLGELGKGAFLVSAFGDGMESVVLVVVSDIVAVTKQFQDKVLIFVANSKDGLPASHSDVMLAYNFSWVTSKLNPPGQDSMRVAQPVGSTDNKGRYEFLSFAQNKTDIKGILKWTLEKKDIRDKRIISVIRKDNDYAICNIYGGWYKDNRLINLQSTDYLYFYTERPVYRPEQKVSFKGIVRSQVKGNFENAPNKEVEVEIRDSKGKEVQKLVYKTNDFGTFFGDYMIPNKASLGMYNVRCKIDGRDYYFQFGVEEYKKPEFQVSLNTANTQYHLGDEVSVEGQAEYYFGGPVANCVVEYTIFKEFNYYYEPFDYDVGYIESFFRKRHSFYYSSNKEVVQKGECFSDDKGKFQIIFKTQKAYENLDSLDEYLRENIKLNGERWTYSIEAKVTDESRRQITGYLDCKVTEKAFFAKLTTEKSIYTPGEKVKIKVSSKNANDEPVKCEGKIFIFSAMYDESKNDYDLTEKHAADIKIDESGEEIFEWTSDSTGYYKVVFETIDQYENIIIGECWFWGCDSEYNGTKYLCKDIEIITDKKLYKIGETAQILINSPLSSGSVLFTIEGDNDIISYEVLSLNGSAKMISLEIKDNFTPNVFLKALTIRNDEVYESTTEIKVPPKNKSLNIEVKGKKERYSPGEEVEFDISVKDEEGKGVSSDISIGFADESIYYIQEDLSEDINDFFYGQVRYDIIPLSTSLDYYSSAEEYGEVKEAYYSKKALESSPEPPMMLNRLAARDMKSELAGAGVMKAKEQWAEAKVRKDFRDTAFWSPSIITDENGKGKIKFKFPDSLTTWRVNAKAITKSTQVGDLKSKEVVAKNIIVRLESPRFFIERDEPVVSAIVHNYLKTAKEVKALIEIEGLDIADKDKEKIITVKQDSSLRIDFPLKVSNAKNKTAKIKVSALTDVESDSMEMVFPIYPHGVEKFIARSGSVESENSKDEILNLPKKSLFSKASLEINISPTIATAIVGALDYLADYPYGCAEQTMSRFIPCVVTAKTLQELNLTNKKIQDKLPNMIEVGLRRIYDFQNSSGGWGWWKTDYSNPYMTAYVLYGLMLAQQADVQVRPDVISRAQEMLLAQLKSPNMDLNVKAYVLFALSYGNITDEESLNEVWNSREKLNDYSKSLLAVTLYKLNKTDKAKIILRNLEDFARVDKDNQTVSWSREGMYYSWYNDGVEATATALQAFTLIDVKHKWTKMIVKWMLNNRRGAKWKSTKDTAIAILALNQYLQSNKELVQEGTIKVFVNEKLIKEINVKPEKIWDVDTKIIFDNDEIPEGSVPVKIKTSGGTEAYYTIYLKYYTSEEDITGGGNELLVQREYFRVLKKISPDKKEIEELIPIKYGDDIKTNMEIKSVVKINAKNNYEYLVFEDMKPSGCEPVQLRSGYSYGNGLCSNMELRDEKVVFFITNLNQGEYKIEYNMRVETPGKFHVMPTSASAMYIPEIRSISDEFRFSAGD